MPRFHKFRTLPHSARTLFDLVLDIETYPQFLPWCLNASVANRTHNTLNGTLTVGTKLIHTSFTSLVRFDAATGIVSMQAHDNLFSRFQSRWHITAAENTSEKKTNPSYSASCSASHSASHFISTVDFVVDFELRNLPLKPLFENLFEQAALRMIEAFEARASFLAAQRSVSSTIVPTIESQ